jgi:GT2 family glycosyltransferase
MNKKIDVSIIIVSYNTADITCESLQSLEDFLPDNYTFETIVVDNASKDNSVEKIKKEFPKVHLIENKENSGFSRANNIGVKVSKGRFVLFFNSDAILRKGTMEYLLKFMDGNEKAGACTSYVEIPTGEVDDAAHRGFPTPWRAICHFSGLAKLFPHSMFFNGYHLAWKDLKTKTHEIDALAGAFMLVRREAGEEVGWWDEDYFFYGEDIDFCYCLKEKGWKIYFIPEVSVLHYKGMSSGIKEHSKAKSKASKETKIWVTNHRFDAMKTFYKKHYQKKYPAILRWLVLQAVELKRNYTLSKLH